MKTTTKETAMATTNPNPFAKTFKVQYRSALDPRTVRNIEVQADTRAEVKWLVEQDGSTLIEIEEMACPSSPAS